MSSPVTELHQMASAGRLLAGVIHEINSPLGSIFSNNEVILRSLEGLDELLRDGSAESLEKVRRAVETCRALAAVDRIACERIRAVIQGLRGFVRVDTSERRSVNLNDHVRDTLRLANTEFGRRITVTADFGELPPVECYPQMLGQVFLNLLVNACQAIDGEGTISVRTRLENGWAHVAIEDFDRAENLMLEVAILASGGRVVRREVAPGEELTDLAAFAQAAAELASALADG